LRAADDARAGEVRIHPVKARTYSVLKGADGQPVIIDVHDGDTLTLALSASEESSVHPALRVKGLYCPELGQTGGLAAWLFVAQLLQNARDVQVTLFGRSFARFVAEVIVDGVDLAQTVIAAGHGKATA
jgi:endonuclease YncB( thermonuclease family)